MKRCIYSLVRAVVVFVPAGAVAQDASAERAIRGLIAGQAAAWNAGERSAMRRNGEWWVEVYHNVDTKPAK